MSLPKPKNIVILGGSLGGLFMGVALMRLHRNLNIRIFERNPTALLHDQGAGVVAGPDVQHFFSTHDRTRTHLSVASQQRLYVNKKGETIDCEDRTQQMTSWDLLYHVLRANYDGVKSEYAKVPDPEDGEGSVAYEYGCTVSDIKTPKSTPRPDLDFSQPIKLTIKHHSGSISTTEADLVIAADGPSSTLRAKYLPDIKRTYAGYVAWRGTVSESAISTSAAKVFTEKFTFFHSPNTQILAYLIPGHNGTLEPGHRLVNWVWYVNYPENSPSHMDLMTDNAGKRHHITLPAGGVREEIWSGQKSYARDVLPHQFAEIVGKTVVPFVQAITDVVSSSAVLEKGRICLIGDALAGLRPHTAMSTSQAAFDALGLAGAIERLLDSGDSGGMEVLTGWEEEVLGYARRLQKSGVEMGERSQFGEHPMAE
ncbi:monooxygenase [Ampelomyces quisqualis]|uniref:Monooxygenase n=1 Tax=Ampelomyces quisqualis TaxID=50730 RepID=A0A6A5QGL1_AMPQU|nr:monooxygenase [Ampelomyces quisqualis]